MSSNEHSLTAPDDPAADDPAESCWLKEAKAALRALDPGEASEDASALSRWADSFSGQLALPTNGASHAPLGVSAVEKYYRRGGGRSAKLL